MVCFVKIGVYTAAKYHSIIETCLIFFLIKATGKNAIQRITTPTNASFQLLYNKTAMSPRAPVAQVIRVLIDSITLFEAVSGSPKNLPKTRPDEFSSKNFESSVVNF